MKIATLFSGGEGVGVGARNAGLHHLWGIEIDSDMAQAARRNGFNVETADILEVNPVNYEAPTVLHASPPCPNFSVAKQGRREANNDICLAHAVSSFIQTLRPEYFTLENVWGYRKSQSWAIIRDALYRYGYWFDLAHVNAANFGVPQTRKRMIVRAAKGKMVPFLPPPEPWVGWYEAIEDLIPTLPGSQLAPWQLKGLELDDTTLVDSAGYPGTDGVRIPVTRKSDEPANTIVANRASRGMRAFLVGGQFARPASGNSDPRPVQTRRADEPSYTVTAQNKGDWRVWLRKGRVVQMTPRALARLQSFPDSYVLPSNKGLACKIIGNAVPPLLYQKIVAQLLRNR